MARNKIALVGAGNIGGTLALLAGMKDLGDITLFDVVEGVPQGKALDLSQCGPVEGFDANIKGSNDYADIAGADVIIVTAGVARKPGMSRDDLLNTNAGIVKSVAENIAKTSPTAILIIVSNPLDVMCYVAMKASGFPRERVIGMAQGNTMRQVAFVNADCLNIAVRNPAFDVTPHELVTAVVTDRGIYRAPYAFTFPHRGGA